MPKLLGVRELYAQIIVKEIGAELSSDSEDRTLYVNNMTILPDRNYRPPGHPERPRDLGPSVYLAILSRGASRYLEAPLLVHQDRYCSAHYNFDAGPLNEFMNKLKEGRTKITEDSDEWMALRAINDARRDVLNYRPIVTPVRTVAKAVCDSPIDALVCFDVIWARMVA